MTTQHTPRPWIVTEKTIVTTVSGANQIAHCLYGDFKPEETAMANARLIAAAPDLLAALKANLEEMQLLTNGERCEHGVNLCWCSAFNAIAAAKAAITKAEGKV